MRSRSQGGTPVICTRYEPGRPDRGETLRSQIREATERWQGELAHMVQMDAGKAIAHFFKGTDSLPAIERWTPDLLDEVRGIAAGAELDWETILAFQLLDQMWSNEDIILAGHCSSSDLPDHAPYLRFELGKLAAA